MSRTVIIVPAREGSSRLPGKLLLLHQGKPLIQHTLERCRSVGLPVFAAVEAGDERLADACLHAGFPVIPTPPARCGTCRVDAAAHLLGLHADDTVINVQGDEVQVEITSQMLQEMQEYPLTTLYHLEGASRRTCVGLRSDGTVHTFTRQRFGGSHQHIGVYAYRRDVLSECAFRSAICPLTEDLEQTAWTERCYAVEDKRPYSLKVDTIHDYYDLTKASLDAN